MAKTKGASSPHHTDEEKITLSKSICDIYETQNCTIDSACDSVGITSRSFYLWAAKISEISEMYKKAKSKSEDHFFEERLKPKVMRSLEKLIDGFNDEQAVEEDVVWQGVISKDDGGNVVKKMKVTRSNVAPNPTSVIFAMKGLFKERFAELSKTESTLTIVNGVEMSPDQYAQLKAIADKE